MRRILAALVVLAACIALSPHASAQVTRTRAIILSFEGWNADQARAAIETGLGAAYDMISEQQAVDTAMQIGVDPSTPEGLGAVVARLHIELVIGGSVSGRGTRATTTIWVTDTQGNQLATRTAGSPSGRGYQGDLTTAALQACGDAVMALHPPGSAPRTAPPDRTTAPPPDVDMESGGGTTTGGGGTTTRTPPTPAPDYDPDYDIENEVAGRPRGQRSGGGSHSRSGGGGGGGGASDPNRWNQPVFRGLIGVDIRNMAASMAGGPAPGTPTGSDPSAVDQLSIPFGAMIGLWLETRPFAQSDDGLRGLYAYVNAAFSAGQSYFRVDDGLPTQPSNPGGDPQQHTLNMYGLDFGVGYAGTISEVVELIGTVGAGLDGLGLDSSVTTPPTSWHAGGDPHAATIDCSGARPSITGCVGSRDFPSYQAWYVRPDVQLRVRMLGGVSDPDVRDALMLELNFGGRIVVNGYGELGNYDFGAPSGGGLDFTAGLGGIIGPGFSYRARFGYSRNFISYGDPGGVDSAGHPAPLTHGDLCNSFCRDSGSIEAFHIQLAVGWAFR
jgi:hypothetical protein